MPSAHAAEERCFPETKECIGDQFRGYWEQNGALPVFGFPISMASSELNRDTDKTFPTQWFERNRFEYHPENAAPYNVLLGRLGDDRLRQLGINWQSLPRESGPKPGCLWFAQTGHNVCDQAAGIGFRSYWQTHGLRDPRLNNFQRSLALFGLPLTEPREETNTSGDKVLTQWFERARFEWHPTKPAPYKVLLGLLGNELRSGTPSQGGARLLAQSVVGLVSVGGNVAVWGEGSGEPGAPLAALHGYNLDTGAAFTLPTGAANPNLPVTDGTTVVWFEDQATPHGLAPRLRGYDIRTRQTFTLRAPTPGLVDYALHNGVLYYIADDAAHFGIFSQVIATGQEQKLSASFGRGAVVGDGMLLWADESTPPKGNLPGRSVLHLIKLDGTTNDTIVKQDQEHLAGYLGGGYGVSGDYVVWANTYGPVQLYRISTGTTTTIAPRLTDKYLTNLALAGDHIVWGMGGTGSATGSPPFSLVDYRISTGTVRAIFSTDAGQVQPLGISQGKTLVFSMFKGGTQELFTVNLE